MNAGRYALSQILDLVHWQTLSRLVAKYEPKTVVRHFGFRQQFVCMVFAQLTSRDGLRDIATCLNARPETLYHLGFTEKVARSTLAEANESRDWRIWEDLAKSLIRKARPLYIGEDLGVELDNTIYACHEWHVINLGLTAILSFLRGRSVERLPKLTGGHFLLGFYTSDEFHLNLIEFDIMYRWADNFFQANNQIITT